MGATAPHRLHRSIDDARRSALWWDGVAPAHRSALDGDADVDVAIAGAGFTGLWTALHLRLLDPSLRVLVVDAQRVGFGASGRNGGWCSAILPMSLDAIASRSGHDAAVRLQRAMFDTVRDVVGFCRRHGIDALGNRAGGGGWLQLARNDAQLDRVVEEVATWRRFGFGDDIELLDADAARRRVRATHVLGGTHTAHCAAVDPAKLVHGLAAVAEQHGVRIVESTAVTSIEAAAGTRRAALRTDRGTVRADVVVRALEGFTPALRGARRDLAPIYSLMIATEPLGADVFDEIGWSGREALNDARTLIVYAQRTADDRIAFGGRGAPYHLGSAVHPSFDVDDAVHRALADALVELFPVLADATVTHRWGGPLGVPRDWFASVRLDRASGLGAAGGYVGDGVASSALAGRTLAELIVGAATERTTLPWVGHRSPRWEPEPLRWLGITTGLALPEMIDEVEGDGRRAPRRLRLLDRLTGQ